MLHEGACHAQLENTISLIQSSATKEQAFWQFNKAMEGYGYNSNVYTLITDHPTIGEKSTHGLAASYPQDWLDYYIERRLQRVDPVWQRLLQGPAPFFWHDAIEATRRRQDVPPERIDEALQVMNQATDAGVSDGIGVSFVSQRGEIAAVGLSRKRPVKDRRFEDMAAIYLLSAVFHEKFMSFYPVAPVPRLTPRERDVLCWAAENKTDGEIGTILGIMTPTVRYHWKNIFTKFGVNGRLPAVVKAIQLRLIDPQYLMGPYQHGQL